jgi:cytochrome b6-f complex iron-sulfur subunit
MTETAPPAITTRRNVLRRLARILGVVALAEVAAVGVLFFRPRRPKPREGGFGGIITAGPVDTFPPGSVTAFAKGQFYLSRMADGGFLALSRRCTHLGCTVPWDETTRRFICPCHASSFDATGAVLSAPAPRPLDLYAVSVERGVVKVDTSTPRTRDRFEPGQAVRP